MSAFLHPNIHLLAQASQGQGPHRTGFSSRPRHRPCPGVRGAGARSGRGPQGGEKVVFLGWAWPCPDEETWSLSEACGKAGTSELVPVALRPRARWWGGGTGEGGAGDPGLCHSLSACRHSPAHPADQLTHSPQAGGWAAGPPV